jgi:hypothetical protein
MNSTFASSSVVTSIVIWFDRPTISGPFASTRTRGFATPPRYRMDVGAGVWCYPRWVTTAATCFDILAELFARDVDRSLVARSLARTPTERVEWLEEMQAFAEAARKARADEAAGAAPATR